MITEQDLSIWLDSGKGPYTYSDIGIKGRYIGGIQLRIYNANPNQYYWSRPDNGRDYAGPYATIKEALLALNMVGIDKIKELNK